MTQRVGGARGLRPERNNCADRLERAPKDGYANNNRELRLCHAALIATGETRKSGAPSRKSRRSGER